MLSKVILTATAIISVASAQQAGTPETHPKLLTQICSKSHGCKTQQTSIVLDSSIHAIQNVHTGASCLNSTGGLDASSCSTVKACANNCAIEGISNYAEHGVTTHGDSMTLKMYLNQNGQLATASPRVYLLDPSGRNYEMLKLLGQELAFDVDVSNLPCGMNGAFYLSEMEADGGRSKYNQAGATYGTGYCDAQCFTTGPFLNGEANVNSLGACCNEMDIWEANARATALTPHTCNVTGFYECKGDDCGSTGVCDKDGCSFNPYVLGSKDYYGMGSTVNTKQKMTVVTSFHTDDGSTHGTLTNITRKYIQNGKVINSAVVSFEGKPLDDINQAYCDVTAADFTRLGGLKEMGEALGRGMVLVASIWNDQGGYMNWLDSGNAGPCNATEGNPAIIQQEDPGTDVVFSNIRWGDIGSTC